MNGSINSVQSLFAGTAIASQRPMLAFLNDLQASILLKPLASTPVVPPEQLVLNAASLTISPFISWYRICGTDPQEDKRAKLLARLPVH